MLLLWPSVVPSLLCVWDIVWVTPDDYAQGFFLDQCSRISPGVAQRTICCARDHTWDSCVQASTLPTSISPASSFNSYLPGPYLPSQYYSAILAYFYLLFLNTQRHCSLCTHAFFSHFVPKGIFTSLKCPLSHNTRVFAEMIAYLEMTVLRFPSS